MVELYFTIFGNVFVGERRPDTESVRFMITFTYFFVS